MKSYLYLFVVCLSLCACKGKTIQQITLENQKHRFDSIWKSHTNLTHPVKVF